MSMMGGTALLEELLAEQAAQAAPQEPEPESPAAADLPTPGGSATTAITDVSGSDAAVVAPVVPPVTLRQRGDFNPPSDLVMTSTSGLGQQGDEFITAVDMAPPPSPLSRQIAELAQEMDDCLGTFEQWEDDKRRHRENLLRELEAQYGVDSSVEADEPEPMFGAVSSGYGRRCLASQISHSPEASSAEVSIGVADEVLARLRDEEEIEKRSDHARISQLRAEVEELRLKAGGSAGSMLAAPLSLAERGVGTPHPGLVLDASLSGLDSTLGLQAWREEVDAVLGDQSFEDELRAGSPDAPNSLGLATLEGQLEGARERVRLLEDAVESAHLCAEGELGELDQLLSECEELHAKLMTHGAEEGCAPHPFIGLETSLAH